MAQMKQNKPEISSLQISEAYHGIDCSSKHCTSKSSASFVHKHMLEARLIFFIRAEWTVREMGMLYDYTFANRRVN